MWELLSRRVPYDGLVRPRCFGVCVCVCACVCVCVRVCVCVCVCANPDWLAMSYSVKGACDLC
jgi:hypothetical protein